jgi:hypothetical protein
MPVPAIAAVAARLAPMAARVGASSAGQAAKAGAVRGVEAGVAGRVSNMIQGRDKDSQPHPSSLNGSNYPNPI